MQNILLKEEVLQEKVAISNLKFSLQFVQNSMRLFVNLLLIRADARVMFSDSLLTVRLTSDN